MDYKFALSGAVLGATYARLLELLHGTEYKFGRSISKPALFGALFGAAVQIVAEDVWRSGRLGSTA